MIRINLLPVRDIVRRQKFLKQIIATLIGVGCIVGLLVVIELFQLASIGKVKEELADIETEKAKYTKILAEIKKIEEEKKVLTTKIEVINQLKQSSSLTVHALDEIANLTPANRMWLKSLTQNGAQLELKGMALDDQTIARYMDDLEASAYIQNVRLAGSSLETYAERSLKAFSITANVDMPKK
ncbi:MAG: PilN domain-containing protein [Desulfobulbus sp.]|jgi:type IV pilus assembly protein PilN|uniref:PilN domain-containing protein n=1 Tax=Desulfobulbus sp. TaxID=895 RepID=UPI0028410422|nr:PilN domain-containing protein [Desulfobulbus sp.]MDR2549666.1 PilN domain-containing protein [Desulfobulbus sp.]